MYQAPVFFRAISTETVPNVSGHHFFDVFLRVATDESFSVMLLADA